MSTKRKNWPGLKIKHALESEGISQSDLARELGVTPGAVHNEIFVRQWSERIRRAIAAKIGVDAEEIWPEHYTDRHAA